MKQQKKRYTLGLDPGRDTGVAVFDRETDKITLARSVTFWGFFREILPSYPPDSADVIIEDARLNKSLYARHDNQNAGTREAIGRKVGSVQAESRLIIEGLRLMGYNVLPIKPSGQKWDAVMLKRMTGITTRTNEHVRDAIRFCYGVKYLRENS
jgi:hypothetical protein